MKVCLLILAAIALGCSSNSGPIEKGVSPSRVRWQAPVIGSSAPLGTARPRPPAKGIPASYQECVAMGGDDSENASWNGGGRICTMGYDARKESVLFDFCLRAGG